MALVSISSATARLQGQVLQPQPKALETPLALQLVFARRGCSSLQQLCRNSNGNAHGSFKKVGRTNVFIHATLAGVIQQEENKSSKATLPCGETWSIHKFGGTCVGTYERIQNVAKIVVDDPSLRKVVVVSAMSKVTDMLYSMLEKAQSRRNDHVDALDLIFQKHKETATALLGEGDDLSKLLSNLEEDTHNLRAMLRAIYIAGHVTESFSDFVVGHGELWSAQMLAAAVRKRGLSCVWMDTREVLVVNPTSLNQVDPDFEASENKLLKWYTDHPADTIIATGFIASTSENVPTTLKRDGSDFSAAILGALFRAKNVTIWTDVDGVYSADPRKVQEAVVLESLSYQEAWELSYFGANVLHPRTTIPVMKYDIPVTIRNVFNISAPGTKICRFPATESGQNDSLSFRAADLLVKGFATIDNLALVNVEGTGMAGVPGTASDIFATVKEVGANVVMISQASSEHSVCFAVPEKEVMQVANALEKKFRVALEVGRLSRIEVVHDCCVLAAVGQRMASTPGVSATLFGALAKANINVRAIAQGCSEYNITVVVNQEDSVRALNAVHSRFYLSRTSLAVGIIGPGLIGGTLLEQLREQAATLKEDFKIDLRVLGIMGSRSMILNNLGLDLSQWRQQLAEKGENADLERFTTHMHSNHSIPNTVIVDCTANAEVAGKYYQWLKRGIHIVTPNKRANSGPLNRDTYTSHYGASISARSAWNSWLLVNSNTEHLTKGLLDFIETGIFLITSKSPIQDYLQLRELQRQSYTHYFYEATVGAGLPIISTLRGFLETGDKIQRIEGIFSGTLSYIFNNLSEGKTFSQIVSEAKAAGYTEPDPRDDLSGLDVARKVIILARESGLRLELDDIRVQSLVPEPLQACSSADEFMEKLSDYDHEISTKRDEANLAGEVLRYVGLVDVLGNTGSVELRRYPSTHPFAQLSGSDNIISFTTARYQKQPLIVRGPGAGADVTAGGVFSDMLRLASYLGAPS